MSSALSRVFSNAARLIKGSERGRRPTKADSFRLLTSLDIPVASIIDVGVQEATPELISVFADLPQVLCEPIKEFHPKIRKNYAGHVESFLIIPHAIGKEDGDIHMETTSVTPDRTITHAKVISDQDDTQSELRSAKMKTLDSIMSDLDMPEPHLLKIDVDGADMEVIQGAEKTLKNCSVICIEAGVKNLHERLNVIRQYGFVLFDLVDICYYDDRLIQVDAIFVRSDIIKALGLDYKDAFDISKWRANL